MEYIELINHILTYIFISSHNGAKAHITAGALLKLSFVPSS
jgi:hypothetical protein